MSYLRAGIVVFLANFLSMCWTLRRFGVKCHIIACKQEVLRVVYMNEMKHPDVFLITEGSRLTA